MQSFGFFERNQQIKKVLTCRFPEVPDINPRKDDLLITFFHSLPGFSHRVGDVVVAAFSPRIGYGTEGAVIIASVLDFKEAAGPVAPGEGAVVVFDVGQPGGMDFSYRPFFQPAQPSRDMKFFLRPQYQVNTFDVPDFAWFKLCIAPHHHYHGIRIVPHCPADDIATVFIT